MSNLTDIGEQIEKLSQQMSEDNARLTAIDEQASRIVNWVHNLMDLA